MGRKKVNPPGRKMNAQSWPFRNTAERLRVSYGPELIERLSVDL
jgi:hypothetical protein